MESCRSKSGMTAEERELVRCKQEIARLKELVVRLSEIVIRNVNKAEGGQTKPRRDRQRSPGT